MVAVAAEEQATREAVRRLMQHHFEVAAAAAQVTGGPTSTTGPLSTGGDLNADLVGTAARVQPAAVVDVATPSADTPLPELAHALAADADEERAAQRVINESEIE